MEQLGHVFKSYICEESLCKHLLAAVNRALLRQANSSSSKGMIIQAQSGGGKTGLLTNILSIVGPAVCYYVDCANLKLSDRGTTERSILNAGNSGIRILLLDNIDYLPSTTRTKESSVALLLSSTSFTSAVSQAIDRSQGFILATCTNAKAIEPALVQPYRLDKPVVLNPPAQSDRLTMFTEVLSSPSIHLVQDAGFPTITTFCEELALRTHGFTSSEIMKLLRDQCQGLGLSPAQPTVSVSAAQLLRAVSLCSASSAQLSATQNEAMRFVRPAAYDAAEPVLYGMDEVKQQLLGCVGTLVPELLPRAAHEDDSEVRPTPLRRCSGLVLCGPSGSGKTALADWLAHATRRHCRFLSVPCADLVHKVVGETERKLAEIFATARTLSPCIVLLDNLDMLLGGAGTLQPDSHDGQQQEDSLDTSGTTPTALPVSQKQGSVNHSGGGRKVPLSKGRSKQPFTPRSTRTRHQAVDRMLSTLLVEIDGVYSGQAPEAFADTLGSQYKANPLEPSRVLVVATTTTMKCLDRALVRPGRLEEHITLRLPSRSEREEFALALLGQLAVRGVSGESAMERCRQRAAVVAAGTEGRSYAHLRGLYQEANIALARNQLLAETSGTIAGTGVVGGDKVDRLQFVMSYMEQSVTSNA